MQNDNKHWNASVVSYKMENEGMSCANVKQIRTNIDVDSIV